MRKKDKATLSGPHGNWWIFSRGDFATDVAGHLSRKAALKQGNKEYAIFMEQERAKLHSRRKPYVGQGRYSPQIYRGKDVTGALSYVRALSGDLWDLMPEEDRPTTDRGAASYFFQADRGGHNMAEFLGFLKDHNDTEELNRLANQPRKPAKKVTKKRRIGTRWPEAIVLPPREYDRLRAIIAWLEAAPKGVEPPEEEFDRVTESVQQALDRADPNSAVYVTSTQIETSKTKTAHTHVGAFVALLEDDASIDACVGEYHCYIQRGKRK